MGTTLAITGTILLALVATMLALMDLWLAVAGVALLTIPLWCLQRGRCPACGEIVGDVCHGDDCKARPDKPAATIARGCGGWLFWAILVLAVLVGPAILILLG